MKKVVLLFVIAIGVKMLTAQTWQQTHPDSMQYANTSYLEVLIAQSAWLDAQLQQTADWLEGQQSMISLFKAVCGGIE